MQRIHINVGAVRSTHAGMLRKPEILGDTADNVSSLKAGIDSRILARKGIGPGLNQAVFDLRQLEHRIINLNYFVGSSMDRYATADNSLSKQAENLESKDQLENRKFGFWDYFFANAWEAGKSSMGGYAMFAAAKNLLQIADGVNFKLFKENGRVILKLVGDAMTTPADYLNYRNLLIDKLGGRAGDWKKGYVKKLMNKGIVLYDGVNEHYNHYRGFREAVQKFSNTNMAALNQYVKNLGEPWYKVAGSAFKNSMIDNTKAVFADDWKGYKGATANVKVSKALGVFGTVVMVGENARSAYQEGSFQKFAVDTSVDLASGVGSMAAGAAVGSFFLPPVGTAVGAVAGAGINLMLNWKFTEDGKSVVDATKDIVNKSVDKAKDIVKDSVSAIGKKLDKIFW